MLDVPRCAEYQNYSIKDIEFLPEEFIKYLTK
jgi:hypothetical protein